MQTKKAEKLKPSALWNLCKKWAEWRSRAWIGNGSPDLKEIAQFLEGIEGEGIRTRCRTKDLDIEEIVYAVEQGWTTMEEELPAKEEEIEYEIEETIFSEYPLTKRKTIAKLTFTYTPILFADDKHTKVQIYDMRGKISFPSCIEWRFDGGDGNDIFWAEIPSEPRLFTQDGKEFFEGEPSYVQEMDCVTTDCAMLLKKRGKMKRVFDVHSEQLF